MHVAFERCIAITHAIINDTTNRIDDWSDGLPNSWNSWFATRFFYIQRLASVIAFLSSHVLSELPERFSLHILRSVGMVDRLLSWPARLRASVFSPSRRKGELTTVPKLGEAAKPTESPSPMTRQRKKLVSPVSALCTAYYRAVLFTALQYSRGAACCSYSPHRSYEKSGYNREHNRRVKNKSRKCFIPM